MDGLMAAFVAALLLQLGDRPMRLSAALAAGAARPMTVVVGAGVAIVVANVVAAVLGGLIAPLMPPRAARLLLALALLSAGASGLFPLKAAAPQTSRIGAFGAALFGCLALALGDRAQFVTTALAARGPLPALAGIGGALGSLAVIVPAALAGDLLGAIPLGPVRLGIGVLFLGCGGVVALGVFGLI